MRPETETRGSSGEARRERETWDRDTHRVSGQDLLVLVLNGRLWEGSSAWVTGQSTQLFRNETACERGEARTWRMNARGRSRTCVPRTPRDGRTNEKPRQAEHRNTTDVSVAGPNERAKKRGATPAEAASLEPQSRDRPPTRARDPGGDGDVVRLVANKSPGQRLSLNRSQ